MTRFRPIRAALPLFLGLLIAAVSPGAANAQVDQSATLPSVELPADVERVLRDYEREWAAGNAEGLAALFTPDGFVLSGGGAHIRGRDRIRENYANAGGDLRLRAVDFEAEGDVAWIIGAYGYDEAGDRGKFVLALERVDGRWYIAADIDNPIRGGP